jgi:membrane associated rhomboid family serine protease
VAQTAYRPPSAFSILPPVIKNLLIINGLFFLAQLTFEEFLVRWLALWPVGLPDQLPQLFWPWQLVTYSFLHGGFGHLFFNLFGLWMFGMRIENVLGSRRFAFFYLACVLGAGLLQLVVISAPFLFGVGDPALAPTLGASGGVLGVLAAFGLLYPDEPIYLYFFVPVPAKWLVLGLAALDLYAGYAGTNTGVAHFAHIGGMITGALLIQYWRGRLPFKPRRRPT